jgi:hypothetical protein
MIRMSMPPCTLDASPNRINIIGRCCRQNKGDGRWESPKTKKASAVAGKLSFDSAPFFGAKARKKSSARARAAENDISHAPASRSARTYFFLVVFFFFNDRLAAFFFFAMALSPPLSCVKCMSWKSPVNGFFKNGGPIFSRRPSA